MKRLDSLKTPNRRMLLEYGLGAGALLAWPFPALAAVAWNAPRRRAYWEAELLNALRIVDCGWSTPEQMRGSWAGAMGHTQWMPEVWLNVGIDYDGDGRVSPFGKPDDALGSTAKFLVDRGKYQRGEHWGYEVRASGDGNSGSRT